MSMISLLLLIILTKWSYDKTPSKKIQLETYNPNLTELILKRVLMYFNVFSYWRYL